MKLDAITDHKSCDYIRELSDPVGKPFLIANEMTEPFIAIV